jgi:hypothetical protein
MARRHGRSVRERGAEGKAPCGALPFRHAGPSGSPRTNQTISISVQSTSKVAV